MSTPQARYSAAVLLVALDSCGASYGKVICTQQSKIRDYVIISQKKPARISRFMLPNVTTKI